MYGRRLDHIGESLDFIAVDKDEGKDSKWSSYLLQKLNNFISRWRKEYLLGLSEHEKNRPLSKVIRG